MILINKERRILSSELSVVSEHKKERESYVEKKRGGLKKLFSY
jgi:hypothetical protein